MTTKSEIKQLCIDGLETDGGHHKQWYLEQILIKIGYDLEKVRKEEQEKGYGWYYGIAP